MRSPCMVTKSSPYLLQLEKAPKQQRRLSIAKNKMHKWIFLKREQNMPPQNIPRYYIDYSELKPLEQWLVQATLTLLYSLKAGNKSSKWSDPPCTRRVERHPYHQIQGIQGWEGYVHKPVISLLIYCPKFKFLCLVSSSQIYVLSERYKNCHLWSLWISTFHKPLCI